MRETEHWLSPFRDVGQKPLGRLLGWRGRRLLERAVLHAAGLGPNQPVLQMRPEPGTASLFAVGDIGLHCLANLEDGCSSLVAGLSAETQSADLRIGNLESVLTSRRPSYSGGIAAVPEAVRLLEAARVDAVTCANNHVFDCGDEGLAESLSALQASGIRVCGAGRTPEDAGAPATMRVDDLLVGMLGYTDDYNVPPRGSACVAQAIERRMLEEISRLRHQVDLVVVQAHWGFEWVIHPLLFYRDLARRCVDAGADLVLCHHAHVPMAVEKWNQGVVAHGLGNLLFGWKQRPHPWCDLSLGLRVSFSRAGVHSAEIVPIRETADHRLAPTVGWRRREALSALNLMARSLQDDDFLADLQGRLVIAEALSLARTCERALRSGERLALHRARSRFDTPRMRLVTSCLRKVAPLHSTVLSNLFERLSGEKVDDDGGFLDAIESLGDGVEEAGRLP